MKLVIKFSNCLFLTILLFYACQEKKEIQEKAEVSPEDMSTNEPEEKLLRHVVIFKFNEDSSEEDINRLNDEFNSLADAITVVKDFEWGLNDSPENFHQGFTHCYLLTFASEADRDSTYAPHPLHQRFVKNLGPHLEKVFVVDYWTNP